MIREGKTPREGNRYSLLSEGSDYRILRRIYDKYVRIMEFFTEAKDKSQLELAKKEFQEILRVLNEISFIESINIETSNPSFGTNEEKVKNRLRHIKKEYIYFYLENAKKFTIQQDTTSRFSSGPSKKWSRKSTKRKRERRKKPKKKPDKMQQTQEKRSVRNLVSWARSLMPWSLSQLSASLLIFWFDIILPSLYN